MVRSVPAARRHALAAAMLLAAGCSPEIGDECSTNVDCSTAGDRVCDTTAPGGYCTIPDCDPDTCPEEAVCVAWGEGLSERTYCVRHCGSDDDCRDGYRCFDPAHFGRCAPVCADDPACSARYACTPDLANYRPADWGIVVDRQPRGSRFCAWAS